ncbi:MAG: transglutaminase-like domain-containing protein [Thermosphaera sp.]
MPRLLLLILMLAMVLATPLQADAPSVSVPVECRSFYFLNAIWITYSNITETLLLESPVNFTLGSFINQTVVPVYSVNVNYNETSGTYAFNVTAGEGFYGYLVNKVEVCTPKSAWNKQLITMALANVSYAPYPETGFPSDIVEKYVHPPHELVVNVVVPGFEEWFNETYGVGTARASYLGLAVSAAYFIYLEFITYNASATPNSIEEVIQTRQGDCDDMSRILVELLSYYGIPSTIAYGYVYIPDARFERFEMPVENVTYIFRYNGPHAFVLTYIPGYEWISVDLLAGSIWYYPFLFEGESVETTVNESDVEQMIDLHRSINGSQLIAVFHQEEFTRMFGTEVNSSLVEAFINETILGSTSTSTTHPTQSTTETTQPTQPTSPATPFEELSPTPPVSTEPSRTLSAEALTVMLALVALALIVIFIIRLRKR